MSFSCTRRQGGRDNVCDFFSTNLVHRAYSLSYWSLEDGECHDILTFTGPLADLENGLTHFQVKDGYLIFMLTTQANQDVKDKDGSTHNREDVTERKGGTYFKNQSCLPPLHHRLYMMGELLRKSIV